MSNARRRRLTAASMALTAALALSACGTGFSAQTNQVYQASVGADARGDVDSFNTLLVGNADGTAALSASLVSNDVDRTLISVAVTTADGDELTVRGPREAVPLPAELLVKTGGKNESVFVVTEGAEPGDFVDVTFTFSDSSPLTVNSPVVLRSAEYDSIVGGTTAGSATPSTEE